MKKLLIAAMTVVTLAGCANMGAKAPERSAGQVIDDATIVTRIKAALVADPELSALKINVDSTKGAVLLRGDIKTMVLRRKAEALARGVSGVKSVDNQMVITG